MSDAEANLDHASAAFKFSNGHGQTPSSSVQKLPGISSCQAREDDIRNGEARRVRGEVVYRGGAAWPGSLTYLLIDDDNNNSLACFRAVRARRLPPSVEMSDRSNCCRAPPREHTFLIQSSRQSPTAYVTRHVIIIWLSMKH